MHAVALAPVLHPLSKCSDPDADAASTAAVVFTKKSSTRLSGQVQKMVALSVVNSFLSDSIENLPFFFADLSDATRYVYYFASSAIGESKDIVALFEANGLCMLRIYSTGFLSYKEAPETQAAREAECLKLDRRSPDYVMRIIEIASFDMPSSEEMLVQFINTPPLVDSLVTSDVRLLKKCLGLVDRVDVGQKCNALPTSVARIVAFDGKNRIDFCTNNELRNAEPLLETFVRLLRSIP